MMLQNTFSMDDGLCAMYDGRCMMDDVLFTMEKKRAAIHIGALQQLLRKWDYNKIKKMRIMFPWTDRAGGILRLAFAVGRRFRRGHILRRQPRCTLRR